jgi:hypothetical protein
MAASQPKPRDSDFFPWRDRILKHFQELSDHRASQANATIYALEHGLTLEELAEVEDLVRYGIANHFSFSNTWPLLMVTATEIGLEYDNGAIGSDYWPLFGRTLDCGTPDQKIRERVKDSFLKFKNRFPLAVEPDSSSIWAASFGIIAWPIVHSILARDAQNDLFRIIFDVLRDFQNDEAALLRTFGGSYEEFGQEILARAHAKYPSTRLDQFDSRPKALGLITSEIISHAESEGSSELIAQDALEKISHLLTPDQRNQIARDLTAVVRRVSENEVARRTGQLGSSETKRLIRQANRTTPGLVASARRKDQIWEIQARVPQMFDLQRDADAREAFSQDIRWTDGTILPGRTLLYGERTFRLSAWPTDSVPIRTVDGDLKSDRFLSLRLDWSEWRSLGSSLVIFKIQKDLEDRGELTKTGLLSPGARYLLIDRRGSLTSEILDELDFAHANIGLPDANAYILDVSANMPDALKIQLSHLGLWFRANLRVEPLGLGAVAQRYNIENEPITWSIDSPLTLRITYPTGRQIPVLLEREGDPEIPLRAVKNGGLLSLKFANLGLHWVNFQLPVDSTGLGDTSGSVVKSQQKNTFPVAVTVISPQDRIRLSAPPPLVYCDGFLEEFLEDPSRLRIFTREGQAFIVYLKFESSEPDEEFAYSSRTITNSQESDLSETLKKEFANLIEMLPFKALAMTASLRIDGISALDIRVISRDRSATWITRDDQTLVTLLAPGIDAGELSVRIRDLEFPLKNLKRKDEESSTGSYADPGFYSVTFDSKEDVSCVGLATANTDIRRANTWIIEKSQTPFYQLDRNQIQTFDALLAYIRAFASDLKKAGSENKLDSQARLIFEVNAGRQIVEAFCPGWVGVELHAIKNSEEGTNRYLDVLLPDRRRVISKLIVTAQEQTHNFCAERFSSNPYLNQNGILNYNHTPEGIFAFNSIGRRVRRMDQFIFKSQTAGSDNDWLKRQDLIELGLRLVARPTTVLGMYRPPAEIIKYAPFLLPIIRSIWLLHPDFEWFEDR